MYICKDCDSTFIKPYERNIDVGIHFDMGIIGKHKVPAMSFCPECNSRNYEEVCENETRQTINPCTERVLVCS